MLSALSPARRRLLLALLAAALVLVSVLVVALVRGGDGPATPVAQDRPGPVLLIPGYGGSTDALQSLATRLRAQGRDARVVELPDGGTGDLVGQATALGVAVTAALAGTGATSVDLVGYSAGGVVARIWVREQGGAALTRRVVTLGSPHHGTRLASLAGSLLPGECPQACRQLIPDSDLLHKLNSGDETPAGPQWVSVWSTVDEVVSPPDSARLDGAVDLTVQGICPSSQVRHSQLPTDPVVQGIVLSELGVAPVAALSTSDCARLGS
ncbi:MAG TPA: lipase [Mycobacteriales bacterium]|nr:lipase [Mycobacteriales bacterium]